MSYNHYEFMLDHYRQRRSDGLFATDPGVVAVRKALHNSYQHEASRMKERYRHEMARQRRQQLENERMIKIRISELKRKEREISKRYAYVKTRVTNGNNVAAARSGFDRPRIHARPARMDKLGRSLQHSSVDAKHEFGAYRIPRSKGKEKILVFPPVDANGMQHGGDNATMLQQARRFEKLSVNSPKLRPLAALKDSDTDKLLPSYDVQLHGYSNGFPSTEQTIPKSECTTEQRILKDSTLPIKNELVPDFLWYYKHREDLGIKSDFFGSRQKRGRYEMLVLDSFEFPRPEQIRVDQIHPHDPRSTYDILALEEDTSSPDTCI